MPEPDWKALDLAWQPARAAGVLGSATTEEIVAHAAGYVPAAWRVRATFRAADLGTGAGVPGVVLAALHPRSEWVLVDGNARRCEFARSAVRALELGERVEVVHARAEEFAHSGVQRGGFDLVVARSFGPPADLAECGLPLLRAPDGQLVVSATDETAAQWQHGAAAVQADFERWHQGGTQFVALRSVEAVPQGWPRRPNARRRSPIF